MIKTVIEINKEKKQYFLPENWSEITLKHLINLELWRGDNTDPVGLLACFLDIDPEILANSKSNLWKELLTVFSYVFTPPKWHNLKKKDKILMDGKYIHVPKQLELERFGQKVLSLQYMVNVKDESDQIKAIPDILTVYFQPLYDGKFSRLRLDYVKNIVMNIPAIDAVPIGRFFFRKLLRKKSYGKIGLTQYRKIMSRIFYLMQQEGKS